jgi:4-alpha-glucanotransferase
MKVLQFAFGSDIATTEHIPHNYLSTNYIAYPGTHDNNTTKGWFENDLHKEDQKRLKAYAGNANVDNVHVVLTKLAMSSIAELSIISVQDLLGLDQFSRMNTPASVEDNWLWRLKKKQLHKRNAKDLLNWTKIYGRI